MMVMYVVEAAVLSVNESCDDQEALLTALGNEHLALSDVIPANVTYYSTELKQRSLDKKKEVRLDKFHLTHVTLLTG